MADSPPTKRRYLRFGLKTLLVLMIAVSVPLAWKFNRLRAQRRVVQAAIRSEGVVIYDYEAPEELSPGMGPDADPPGPRWLRALLGNDLFAEVVYLVWSDQDVEDEILTEISRLPALRVLSVKHVTDDRLEQISRIASLTHLYIDGDFTDEGIAHLSRLPKLETLILASPHLTEGVIPHLVECKRLECVDFKSSRHLSQDSAARFRLALPECEVTFR